MWNIIIVSRCCLSIFFEKGLVTRKTSKVNWDPVDNTRAYNDSGGRRWHRALVEQRELDAMVLQDHRFQRGIAGRSRHADQWPESPPDAAQLIGKSEGLQVCFTLDGKTAPEGFWKSKSIPHAPTRYRCSGFVGISADHPLAKKLPKTRIADRLHQRMPPARHSAAALETAEKKGFDTGVKVKHPSDENWEPPVYVANFVLMEYGTGRAAVVRLAHDQRDLDFANKYKLKVTPVVMPKGEDAAGFSIGETGLHRRWR